MQALKTDRPVVFSKPANKFIFTALLLVVLLAVVLYANNIYQALKPAASLPEGMITLSQSALAEKYGLRVNLVAVTAAGGMVDLRLKIINGDKAKLLLQDKKNFPTVFVNGNVTLNASEDAKSQQLKFEDNGDIFLMFPNAGNAVKQGATVTILFGDTALEPMKVK